MDGAATIATTPQDITAALAYVVNEQDHRQAALEHHLGPNGIRGLDSYLHLPDPPPRIVVYIDEITAIAGPAAALNYTRDEIQANTNYLAEIAQRGRSAGVALRIMTQRPTLLGTFGSNTVGGGIFSSLAQRFHFDREAESLKAAFNHCERISNRVLTLIASGTAGRCAYAYARPEDYGRVKAGQIAWVSPEQARQFALGYEGPPAAPPNPNLHTTRTTVMHPARFWAGWLVAAWIVMFFLAPQSAYDIAGFMFGRVIEALDALGDTPPPDSLELQLPTAAP